MLFSDRSGDHLKLPFAVLFNGRTERQFTTYLVQITPLFEELGQNRFSHISTRSCDDMSKWCNLT